MTRVSLTEKEREIIKNMTTKELIDFNVECLVFGVESAFILYDLRTHSSKEDSEYFFGIKTEIHNGGYERGKT